MVTSLWSAQAVTEGSREVALAEVLGGRSVTLIISSGVSSLYWNG